MPQFDAGEIVEGLECKLKPYADFEGIIPEPSDAQIGEFLAGLKRVIAEAPDTIGLKEDADLTDPAQLLAALNDLDTVEFVKAADALAGLHAGLCSGTPSKAQILAVPIRRRNLFYQWLQTEVLSPEAAPGGGNGQANHLPLSAVG